ncbi:DUF192 domain-containing protein [Acidithiobacillus sp. AMEEHan]|uniref:DUF192 domain-containing protein n=1 Tax=Acidithiobacillus sp. AMEEHan TaxID=2994951 RepID=UPI0027E4D8F8|nr:DUF192 domain-containing protein [Acidithiobacillus sp. AMEEHan]
MSQRGSIWRGEECVWAQASLASDPLSRSVGLLGKKSLHADQALWLLPCRAVHMFGMRFALDLLWLDRAGQVLAVRSNVRPWQLAWPRLRGVHSTIEVAVGEIASRDIALGQKLHWREMDV